MPTVQISSRWFLTICAAVSVIVLFVGGAHPFSAGVMALEVFLTIIALFVFGSTKYQLDKNALTYGAVLIIGSTFWTMWWPASALRLDIAANGSSALWPFARHYLFSLDGLDSLIHADTMLFILGLTFFVSVIAQTRMLESISFKVLRKTNGYVLPTVAILAGLVSFASGILDGVSMIGLMIRTLVIILVLARAADEAIIFSVIISTIVTTVCGMWLAYGEPPNLIMKANLHPHLTNMFFIRFCLPVAIGSYFIVFWNLRQRLKGKRVKIESLDVLDEHIADLRFMQASRHGEVLTPIEFADAHSGTLGTHAGAVLTRLHHGESFGEALHAENIPTNIRLELLSEFSSVEMAKALDDHYAARGKKEGADVSSRISSALNDAQRARSRAQMWGTVSFFPFVGLLIVHGINHEFPLFWASIVGFAVAFVGIASIKKMRTLAIHEALTEYKEYLFLLPLFLSITLLQKSGFFDSMAVMLERGIETLGKSVVALIQFSGAVFLSALLDNNVVADFASRALHGLELGTLHLFSMAQIAGYAAGGCWTHIGSAQSVVAYAFIRKEVNDQYTPFQWIKAMTPVIVEIFVLMVGIIWLESWLLANR